MKNENQTLTFYKSNDIDFIEIDKIPSELYGTTTAAGTVEQAMSTGFLSCGDGSNYVITKDNRNKIRDHFERVIITVPFSGNAQTVVSWDGKLSYFDGSIYDYITKKDAEGVKLDLVTWDEFIKLHNDFYIRPFSEISEDTYTECLECLPPHKWHNINDEWNVFFMSERYSGSITSVYLRNYKTGKYYSGRKSIFSSDAELLTYIQNEIK